PGLVLECDVEEEPRVGLHAARDVDREIVERLRIVRRIRHDPVRLKVGDEVRKGHADGRHIGEEGAAHDHAASSVAPGDVKTDGTEATGSASRKSSSSIASAPL